MRNLKEIGWISSEKYLLVGEEIFIGAGVGLIGMIIEFGGTNWVFVQRGDMGMILTKKVSEFILDQRNTQFYFE